MFCFSVAFLQLSLGSQTSVLRAESQTLSRVRLQSRPGRARAFVEEETGREIIFHGTTASVKGPPWYPEWREFSRDISLAREDFEWMQRLGINLLRLAVFWSAVEPVRGRYNETYLDEIEKVVGLAGEHGVYVFLNGHQDGLSELFCGEGWPAWAIRRLDPGSKEAIGVSDRWYVKLAKVVLEKPVLQILKVLGRLIPSVEHWNPFDSYPYTAKTPFPGPFSQFDDAVCATFPEHKAHNLSGCFYQEDTGPNGKYPGVPSEMATFPTSQACDRADHGLGWGEATYEMSQAYQALYDNWSGIGDSFVEMWAHIGKRFRGRPEVLGYNLINEPFAGDVWGGFLGVGNSIKRYVPWPFNHWYSADRRNLQPLYARINEKLRSATELGGANDPDVLLFLDGVTWGDFGSGFSEPPGGPEYANRTVIAYHYYNPPQVVPNARLGALETVAAHNLEAARLDTGVLLTETESIWSGTGAVPNATESCDRFVQGWVDWEWKSFDSDGPGPVENKVSQNGLKWGSGKTGHGWDWMGKDKPPDYYLQDLARTYPQKVSGSRIVSFFYNGNSSDRTREYARFELEYQLSGLRKEEVEQPTMIFALPERYPGGADVAVYYDGERDESGKHLRVDYRWDGSGSELDRRWIKVSAVEQGAATVKVVVRTRQAVEKEADEVQSASRGTEAAGGDPVVQVEISV